MNSQLNAIFMVLSVLFVIILCPVSVVQAANVDDWLEENRGEPENEADQKNDDENGTAPVDEIDTEIEGSDERNDTSLVVVIVKMTFALLLVLGLIYVLLQILKRKNKLFSKNKALENIGGITVGTNKSMQIIRIGSRFFVIGVGENVEILHEITDQEIVQDLIDEGESDGNVSNRFLSAIRPDKATGQKGDRNFKQLFSRELRNLTQNRKKIMNENKEDTHE